MQPSIPETLFCAECGRPSPGDELARFGTMLVCSNCKERYAQKLREGVTPGRAMAYGGFWIRLVAYIIDAIILAIVGTIVQFAFVGSLRNIVLLEPGVQPGPEVFARVVGTAGLAGLINLAIAAIYEALFVSRLGATPGKMALSLKVVRPDGSLLGLGRAFGRHFAKILSGLILGIGFIMAGFDSEKRGLHDMICDTRVVRSGD
jgi:uncharacterized RDD family membrane protein YckC